MKKIVLVLTLFLSLGNLVAQNYMLSNQAEISVLTIGAGNSLNDAFGHNAFRVKDPTKGYDYVFNYGVYDFETSHFYLKFAQGKLNYSIGFNYFDDFFRMYVSENRTVKEQILNLSYEEKQDFFNLLWDNLKPENRNYLYDFFLDNCATKIKEVTNIVLHNSIIFNRPETYKEASFRTLIQNNLNRNTWGSLGIDVALGSVIDRKATPEEQLFLPENVYQFFKHAILKNTNKSLVKSNKILFSKIEKPIYNNAFTSPLFILGLISLLILYLTFKDYKAKRQSRWLDVTLFTTTGVIGIIILLLWFATNHKGTHQNYNLLWAFALNILFISQILRKKVATWFIKYLKFLVIMLLLLALHWILGVQIFAISLLPFLVALFTRYIFLIYHYNKSKV